MKNSNILAVGCSFTADCGFNQENKIAKHWVSLLGSHYKCIIDNFATGGACNDEIFYKTLDSIYKQNYDMVIVQWSAISRHWIYFNKNNIDDFTIINSGNIKGHVIDEYRQELDQYVKLHYALFNNDYVNLKKWLLQILSLQNILKDTPHVFIKGFDNHINDFQNVALDGSGFQNMSIKSKSMLDFDNRPDDYLFEKIYSIQSLIAQIDKSKWINFESLSFSSNFGFSDLSDDNIHPGPLANNKLFLDINDYCKLNNILL
jgi:hypothetical protein